MRPKSILSAFILLFVIVAVVAIALKKLMVAPSSREAARPAPTTAAQAEMAVGEAAQAPAETESSPTPLPSPVPTSTPASEAERVAGVEGLRLGLCPALMFDVDDARGLAAGDGALYVASVDDGRRVGMLIQARADTYEVVQARAIELDGRYRLGGMALGPSGLWASLAGEGSDLGSTIVLIDPQYLEVRRSFQVSVRIRAVAEAITGEVVGLTEAGDRFFAWDAEGRELRQAPNLTGTAYQDMAVVRGALVCAGETGDGGMAVIDVLEPTSLTRVVRHRSYARSAAGAWITAGGFDYDGGAFMFLPEGGQRPKLMSYTLDATTLEEYVPSAAR